MITVFLTDGFGCAYMQTSSTVSAHRESAWMPDESPLGIFRVTATNYHSCTVATYCFARSIPSSTKVSFQAYRPVRSHNLQSSLTYFNLFHATFRVQIIYALDHPYSSYLWLISKREPSPSYPPQSYRTFSSYGCTPNFPQTRSYFFSEVWRKICRKHCTV